MVRAVSKKGKGFSFSIPQKSKTFLIKLLLVVIVSTLVIIDTIQRTKRSAAIPIDPLRVQGEITAPLHITQYVDFKSPECARGYFLLQDYMTKYPHQILLQTKHFPFTEQGVSALTAAVYVHCSAEQNKFVPFQDLVWQRQPQWEKFHDVAPLLKVIANEAKLDLDQLGACVKNAHSINYVLTERDYAEALFVKGTPTYSLNGEMAVGVQELQMKLDAYFVKK